MRIPRFLRFRTDRSASTAMVLGLAAPAMIAITGLAIDFAGVLAAKTKLELGADAGALVSVMTASNSLRTDPINYIADGVAAGQARFTAQTGTVTAVSSPSAVVGVTRSGNTLTGTATWSASYGTFFGGLFGVPSWPLSGVATVTTQLTAPFLNIEIMLDNSPSMEIGATDSDIAILQQLTPCGTASSSYTHAPGALYNAKANGTGFTNPQDGVAPTPSGQAYAPYQCTDSGSGNSYDGTLACPIPGFVPVVASSGKGGPSCTNLPAQASGRYPLAGAPCAFACHFDTSKPAGAGNDYYGIARSTIGTGTPVTLRFDVVKAAVTTLISTMQANDLAIKNLQVGLFTFDHALTQVYPASGEAGDDWATAIAAVGGPPTVANGPDTGIQPYGGDNGGDTDFPDTMTTLASTLTLSGDGTTAAAPRKVLFMVTDGVQDYTDAHGNRVPQAIDPSYCQTFKDNGYAIYVVYTPYYPLMNGYYLQNMTHVAEGTGAGTTTANLRACASAPGNYIAASDGASLQAALQTFFKLAVNPPAHFTR